MTFSRRAAAEMTRRVERIARQVAGRPAGVLAEAKLPGPAPSTASARACCATTPAIGLDPAFTIHDREDSADLMNLVRHELGLSDREALSAKNTCLAIYSARRQRPLAPLRTVLQASFPWCSISRTS
jgi:DNA helicase II / ATP-dependent DNA helicase PcrA